MIMARITIKKDLDRVQFGRIVARAACVACSMPDKAWSSWAAGGFETVIYEGIEADFSEAKKVNGAVVVSDGVTEAAVVYKSENGQAPVSPQDPADIKMGQMQAVAEKQVPKPVPVPVPTPAAQVATIPSLRRFNLKWSTKVTEVPMPDEFQFWISGSSNDEVTISAMVEAEDERVAWQHIAKYFNDYKAISSIEDKVPPGPSKYNMLKKVPSEFSEQEK
jgi:hypothetical protein